MTETQTTTNDQTDPDDSPPIGRVWLVSYQLLTTSGVVTMDTWLGMPHKGDPDSGLTIKWVEGVRQGLAEAHGAESHQIVFNSMVEMESLDGLPDGGV